LLDYARGLDQDAADAASQGLAAFDAMAVFKGTLADQYAVATNHNRQINQEEPFAAPWQAWRFSGLPASPCS
jgi:hypothetical protein